MGIKELVIAGGEPLMHPQLLEIADFAKHKNLKTALITNGFLVKPNIKKILKSGFSYLRVSIDGEEDAGSARRNCKGAHKDVVDAIELIRQHKIPMAVDFVVTSKNIDKLEDVYNYFSIRNIKVNIRSAINKPEALIPKARKRQIYLRFIKRLLRKGDISNLEYDYLKKAVSFGDKYMRVRCLGLISEFSVDVKGNVSACCSALNGKAQLNGLGNILKGDLEKLWFSPQYREMRVSIFSKGCENCFNPSICELTKSTGIDYLVEESKYRRPLKPSRVHFRFTSRCNLTCKHCDIWKGPRGKSCKNELSVEQWKLIIDKLSDWLGRFGLDLAGGEILLYDGAIELIEYCKEKRISANLTTNATLIDEEVAERLMSSGLYGINLSLDGLAGNHNYIRNREDAYHKVRLAAYNLLKHRKSGNPCVNLAAVITKHNLDDLQDIVQYMYKWGVDGVGFQALDHNFNAKYHQAWFKNNEFWPDDYNKVERVIDHLIRAKLSGVNIHNSVDQLKDFKKYYKDPAEAIKYRCRSGDNNFIVDESGGVRLCWNDEPVADILSGDPAQIWQSRIANQARNRISACSRTCRILNCNYGK